MAEKNEFHEVTILDQAEGGESFARLEDGLSVFVNGHLVPGDQVRIQLTQVKKRQARAHCVEVVQPAAQRVAPPCSYFGACGGCRWQNLPYPSSLELKQKLLTDALHRIGRFADVEVRPIVASDQPYRYRNKAEFVFAETPRGLVLGMHRANDPGRILPIEDCHLVPASWRQIVDAVISWARREKLTTYSPKTKRGCLRSLVIRRSHHQGGILVVLVCGTPCPAAKRLDLPTVDSWAVARAPHAQRPRYEQVEVMKGDGYLIEQFNGLRFRVSPGAFLQPNTLVAEKLYATALSWADLSTADRVLDLYCGMGSLSLLAAGQAKSVTGLEVVPSALEDARYNAQLNGVENTQFQLVNVGGRGRCELPEADVVLLDPPRNGMQPSVVQALRELKPRRIVYVSCKPASFARDAKALCEGGGFQLMRVQAFDQFPQTEHVECVGLLTSIS